MFRKVPACRGRRARWAGGTQEELLGFFLLKSRIPPQEGKCFASILQPRTFPQRTPPRNAPSPPGTLGQVGASPMAAQGGGDWSRRCPGLLHRVAQTAAPTPAAQSQKHRLAPTVEPWSPAGRRQLPSPRGAWARGGGGGAGGGRGGDRCPRRRRRRGGSPGRKAARLRRTSRRGAASAGTRRRAFGLRRPPGGMEKPPHASPRSPDRRDVPARARSRKRKKTGEEHASACPRPPPRAPGPSTSC
ncbi:serine/arginine repetitive matrix protein 3-like [Cavia porcellus]|uniref:serine/arginine repetitive matrix protein 3-like n=1 Tax=Cavia porcellus TaxID=10141 RepID=UPI002FE006CF